MNSVFLRYERFERSFILKPDKSEQIEAKAVKPEIEKPLISFDDEQVDSKLTPINTNNNNNASNEADSLSVIKKKKELLICI